MEGAPAEVDLGEVEKALFGNLGVIAVRDLHVWTITSGVDSLTGHLVVREMQDAAAVVKRAKVYLGRNVQIDHVTIPVKDEEISKAEPAQRRI